MPKRDLERIRALLLAAEGVDGDAIAVDIRDEMQAGDAYQLTLMHDAGLIEGRFPDAGIFRVTNAGHDYLDAVRDQGIWESTKTAVAETGGNAVLEVVKALAVGFIKKKIVQQTGIEF